jgi:hypothetical protein
MLQEQKKTDMSFGLKKFPCTRVKRSKTAQYDTP